MSAADEEGLILEQQFELLRKYQSVDMELERYEKEMRASNNRKELMKYRDFLLEQQTLLKKIGSEVEVMGDRAEALADEVERLNAAVAEAAGLFEKETPQDAEQAEAQIASLQKLLGTITRYESEIAKLRKDADARDRLQHEVRVRAAKAAGDAYQSFSGLADGKEGDASRCSTTRSTRTPPSSWKSCRSGWRRRKRTSPPSCWRSTRRSSGIPLRR